jgi:hypothetical protein
MEQRKLAFLITHLILRIRDFPPKAVDELLAAVDEIERKYDLIEKLTPEEWEAVAESKDDIAHQDDLAAGLALSKTRLSKESIDVLGKQHFEEAVRRVLLRDGDQQGDVADLIFALLDEYFL